MTILSKAHRAWRVMRQLLRLLSFLRGIESWLLKLNKKNPPGKKMDVKPQEVRSSHDFQENSLYRKNYLLPNQIQAVKQELRIAQKVWDLEPHEGPRGREEEEEGSKEVLGRLSQQDVQTKESQQNLGHGAQRHTSLIQQLKHMVSKREAKVKEERMVVSQAPKTTTGSSRPSTAGGDSSKRINSAPYNNKSCLWWTALTDTAYYSYLRDAGAPSGCQHCSEEVRSLNSQCTESRTLCEAACVERDRLLELLKLQQSREEEVKQGCLGAEQKFQGERRRAVSLQQQLEKEKLDLAKGLTPRKTSKKGTGDKSGRQGESSSRSPELTTQRTLQAKAEDLQLCSDMMNQVKHVFLQALRQHK
ncbi:unnamed protein product [Coregonus sp. 'balchen']|nr:unnamed protein product [Coregonus sp. 'balchen']